MQDLMKTAGNVLEELKEVDSMDISKTTEDVWTFTVECGPVYTFLCC